jgi:multidrug efflux pump
MILDTMGVSLNVMVLFSLVLALGMLVDNGIVVVENIYRYMDEGLDSFEAAKRGVSEVAWPIIASTATTLAAFIPLMLWPGIMGEFMKYLPITLMIVLGSSLFVALVINPVLNGALYESGVCCTQTRKKL